MFEQALLENPNDLTLRQVYADWLEERGDPRGEKLRLLHNLTNFNLNRFVCPLHPTYDGSYKPENCNACKRIRKGAPNRDEMEERLLELEDVPYIGPHWTNSKGIEFVFIPPGSYLMGSPKDERYYDDEVQKWVVINIGFWMSKTTITNLQWSQVLHDPVDRIPDVPVIDIFYTDAEKFCFLLGSTYILPSEEMWEYACRAGTTTPYYFRDKPIEQYCNRGLKHTVRPVGQRKPNAFGLYDMNGNVWEICTNDIIKGGSCFSPNALCRSAVKDVYPNEYKSNMGFRICSMELPK